jgi:hypothetical protein
MIMKKILIFTLLLFFTQSTFGQSSDKIRVGDHVIDHFNFTGTVKEIFSNGSAKVELDGLWSYLGLADRKVIELAKRYTCVQNTCVNDRVMDNLSNEAGTIVEVYSNCQLKVKFDGVIGKMGLADRTCSEMGY